MSSLRLHWQYQYELHQLLRQRLRSILLLIMGLLLLFSLFDYLLFAERFSALLPVRLLALTGGLLLLLINHLDRRGRYALPVGLFSYLCACGVTLFILQQTDHSNTSYYFGLIMVMIIYATLTPLTAGQTLGIGCLLSFAYFVSLQLVDHASGNTHHWEHINNLFFMFSFVLVTTLYNWTETKARINESRIRRSDNAAAGELKHKAGQLEQEALRRGREQQEADRRYQMLYESIADAVVLSDAQGRVIQANSAYIDCFCGQAAIKDHSLLECVRESERLRMQQELLTPIDEGKAVADWQTRLRSANGQWLDVEINGVLLLNGDRKIGLQLVIREIGTRKTLEQQLRESLDKVRMMENMTILALAKISEYRDTRPGQHLERIREYCRILATELSGTPPYREIITPLYIRTLCQGSLLHDIGKVAVADEILGKNTPLSAEEEQQFREHTRFGKEFIQEMENEASTSSFLSLARNIAHSHHEHWDGSGYPEALRGAAIPLEARIVALADAYEEFTATSDPEKRLSHLQAVHRIIDGAGRQFDPLLVQAFSNTQHDFEKTTRALAEHE